jgi:hypothetical protein
LGQLLTTGKSGPDHAGGQDAVLKAMLTGPILIFLVFLCWKKTLEFPDSLAWPPYPFSDWLINYEGGFIRRGLFGHLLHESARGTPALNLVNHIVFANFAALSALLFLVVLLSRAVTPVMGLLLVLMPGGAYGMVMGDEFFFRKEVLFEVHLAAVACLFLVARRVRAPIVSGALDLVSALLLLAGSIVLPLVHEGFLFLGAIPASLMLFWLSSRRFPRRALALSAVYLGLMVLYFCGLALFKGSDPALQAIWASLHPADKALIGDDGAPGAAVGALGLSLWRVIKFARSTIASGFGWYWGFIIVASAVYFAGLCQAVRGDVRQAMAWTGTVYAAGLAASLPLFLIGLDWGRWISATNVSVAMLVCAGEFKQPLPREIVLPRWAARISSDRWRLVTLIVLLLFGATFKIPECCITGTGLRFAHVLHLP